MSQEVIVMQYLETVLTDYPRINELNNVERCAFVQVSGAGITVPQYTYACGDRLFIAEKLKDQWQLREETDLAATVSELQVLVGNSPFSNGTFNLLLTKPETLALFAFMDYCRCQFLGEMLDASPFKGMATPEEIAAKAVLSLPYSLCNIFTMNTGNTNDSDVAEGLAGLAEKSVCKPENGQYALRSDFMTLARGLVVVNSSALVQVWDGSGSSVRNLTGYVLQGGLHDIIMTTMYGSEAFRVRGMSSQDLLGVFYNALSCPELPEAKEESASAGPEFCKNCGAKLEPDVRFCPNCGTKV